MTLPVRTDEVQARVNWGRWVADCATPYCRNAWTVTPGEMSWDCRDCGYTNPITWPNDPAAIEYLLAMRPDPATRNWDTHETIEQLLMENAEHGILPPEVREVDMAKRAGYDLLEVEDGRVVDGLLLPAILRRRMAIGDGTYRHLIESGD